MKTQLRDFIYSGILLTVLIILDFLSIKFFVVPLSSQWFDEYHVLIDGFMFLFVYGVLSVICARLMLLISPLSPGDHSMDSGLFTWWKLFTVVYEFGRGALLPFTTVFARPLVAMLFGAKIGKDIALGGRLVDPELITIGDEAIIGQDSVITAHAITTGMIILREVKISRGATVGVNVVIMPGVEVGEGSIVTAGAVVSPNTIIPAGEMWGGIPARKIKDVTPTEIRG